MKDEEAMVLSAFESFRQFCPGARLLLAPRHPERFAEVEQLLRRRVAAFTRRSELISRECLNPSSSSNAATILLLDSMGELADMYAAADVVFIGGSLVKTGGHNLLEPALFKKPIVFGPHMSNFRETTSLFLKRKAALSVRDEKELSRTLVTLYHDASLRRSTGENGYQILSENRGATERVIHHVETFLRREFPMLGDVRAKVLASSEPAS
jgi:3-deoxy-D-manno-octulosonic-acid transferase